MKKINVESMKLGSDAEVFLKDKTGRPFPVCGIIGGTKEEPLILSKDGCAVQEDNVMLEFNTPISSSAKEWVRNLQQAMGLAFAKVPPTLEVSITATERFDPRLLDNAQAQTFGCQPDFNGWTMEQNPRPVPEDPTMRSAAAHVHISWDDPESIEQRCRVIQMADIFVTLPSLTESPDRERRKLYGKAGAMRPKKYGVEHRVLDNYWLTDSSYIDALWTRYRRALTAVNTDFEVSDGLKKQIQEVINNYDVKTAVKLYQELRAKIFPKEQEELDYNKMKMYYGTNYIATNSIAQWDVAIPQNALDPRPQ